MSSPFLGLKLVERVRQRLNELEIAAVGDAEGRHDADRVLVDALEHLLGVHEQTAAVHRDLAHLDVPVARELVPADLHRPADHVRLVGRLALGLHLRAPAPLHRHAAEHAGFARADRRRAERVGGVGAVPQVGEHVDAARLELGRLRILVLVDHVLVDGEIHDLVDLGLLPGLAERRQVLARVAVQEKFVLHDLEGVRGQAFGFGNLYFGIGFEDRRGRRLNPEAIPEHRFDKSKPSAAPSSGPRRAKPHLLEKLRFEKSRSLCIRAYTQVLATNSKQSIRKAPKLGVGPASAGADAPMRILTTDLGPVFS